jgi:molybdate transport system substrate-binding protein
MTRGTRTLAVVAALTSLGAMVPNTASALTVFDATSLKDVFKAIDSRPRYNPAASEVLAKQIRAGAPVDVFASANMDLPTALWRDGLCTKPVVFATNVLVLVTPKSNPGKIFSVYGLTRGVKHRIVMGSPTVPVGIYTRSTLKKLGIYKATLRHNTISTVSNVGLVKAAVIGGADAGFVYYSDWLIARDKLRKVTVPTSAQPPVRYGICRVIQPGVDIAGARSFIRRVRGPAARAKLKKFGFGVPRR